MSMEQLCLSRKQAAASLGIGVRTLDILAGQGAIVPIRLGTRVLYERDELSRFISELRAKADLTSGKPPEPAADPRSSSAQAGSVGRVPEEGVLE